MIDSGEEPLDPLDSILEEFVAQCRLGLSPRISDFQERYPAFADRIGALFPMLAKIESVHRTDHVETNDLPYANAFSSTIPIGSVIGDYVIQREIGRGGMGVVYLATQLSLGRKVALKIMLPSHGQAHESFSRFQAEARIASRLHHPHIVPVHSVGIENGMHYFAMQFIDGQSLNVVIENWRRERGRREGLPDISIDAGAMTVTNWNGHALAASTAIIDNQPIPSLVTRKDWRQVVQWMVQVSDAVQYAHSSGVLHRDIKPSNLILDRDGAIWLMDFGLAKSIGSETLTGKGGVAGTLRYLAPERFSGKLDASSDVYSLGTALYELLILSPPFASTEQGHLVAQIVNGDFVPPRLIDATLPRDLDTIVCKAIALQPKDRYDSAGSLAEDLRRLLAGRPILARRINPIEQSWRWARQNKAFAAISMVAILLLVSITIISALYAVNLSRALKSSKNNLAGWERASFNADTNRVREIILDARRIATTSQPGQRVRAISKLKEAVGLAQRLPTNGKLSDDILCEAVSIFGLSDFDYGESWPVPANYEDARYCVDSDHRRFAVATKQGEVAIHECGTGRLLAALPQEFSVGDISFSADGNFIALGLGRVDGLRFRAQCWDIRDKPRLVWTADDLGFERCQWHPNKPELYLVKFDGSIIARQADSGKTVFEIAPSGPLREVELSPHPYLPIIGVSSYFYHEVQIRSLENGDILFRHSPQSYPRGVTWHPEGHQFLVSQFSGTLEIFSWPQKRSVKEIALYWPGLRSSYSPDGKHLLICGWSEGILIRNVDTAQTLFLRGSENRNAQSWSRDGRYAGVVVKNGKMRRLQFEESKEVSIYRDPEPNKPGVVFAPWAHPKFDVAVFPSSEGSLFFYEASTGSELGGDRSGLAGTIVGWDDDGGIVAVDEQKRTQINYSAKMNKRNSLQFFPGEEKHLAIVPYNTRMSSDSKWLAANYGDCQIAWWPRLHPEKIVTFPIDEAIEVKALSHDGQNIYLKTSKSGMGIYDCTKIKLSVNFESDHFLAASGDDSLIFVSPTNRVLRSGTWQVLLDLPDEATIGAISPNGNFLAVVEQERYIRLFDLKSNQSIVCFEASIKSLFCQSLTFSADEKQLYFVALGSSENILRSINLEPLFASLRDLGTSANWPQTSDDRGDVTKEADARIRVSKLEIRPSNSPRLSDNPFLQFQIDRLHLWAKMRFAHYGRSYDATNDLQLALDVADWQSARQCLTEVIGSAQANMLQNCLAGAIDVQTEDWERAISWFTKCIEIDNQNFDARMGRAYVHWQMGNHKSALEDLQSLKPENMLALGDELKWHFFQSRLYHEMGNEEAEQTAFQKSANCAFSHFGHSLDRWSWSLMYGRVEQCWPKLAEAMSETACHLTPEIHEHKLTLAVIQMRIGKTNSAIYLLEKYSDSKHRSADPWAFHIQALLHFILNNEAEHVQALHAAMAQRDHLDTSMGFPTSSEMETIIRRVISHYQDCKDSSATTQAFSLLSSLSQYSSLFVDSSLTEPNKANAVR